MTSPSQDVRFTAEMSEKMSVPRHILARERGNSAMVQTAEEVEAELRAAMNVPDRILLAGGDSTRAAKGAPYELDVERRLGPRPYDDKVLLSTPPSTLTLAQPNAEPASLDDSAHTPTSGREEGDQGAQSHPEWFRHMGLPYSPPGSGGPRNPLEELAALKRSVGDLKNRVAELEMQNDFFAKRDQLIYLVFSLYIGFKALKSFMR